MFDAPLSVKAKVSVQGVLLLPVGQ